MAEEIEESSAGLTPLELSELAKLQNPDKASEASFLWEPDFQREILSLICNDRVFTLETMPLVQSKYFQDDAHKRICSIVFAHFKKYKTTPNITQITQELKTQLANVPDEKRVRILGELSTVMEFYNPGVHTRDFYREKIVYFAKAMAIRYAFGEAVKELQKSPDDPDTYFQIGKMIKEALLIDRDFEMGLDYFQTAPERYERKKQIQESGDIFTTGFKSIDSSFKNNGLLRGEAAAWMGLCFRKGTKVLMFNGTVKAVEDVKVGDLLMGNDSTPRKVLSLACGQDMMYEIKPVKGDSYYVNSNHVLSLKSCAKTFAARSDRGGQRRKTLPFANHPSKSENVFNIPVSQYLKEGNRFKKTMKGYRTGVEFPYRPVKINPYILGVWLGDGDKHQSAFTNVDDVILKSIAKDAYERELSLTRKDIHYHMVHPDQRVKSPGRGVSLNTFQNSLREYGLLYSFRAKESFGCKHIPLVYKANDRNIRLELLAGLIDTDGSESCNGYEFTNKSNLLAEDVVSLARSLGFAAYIKPCKKKCHNNGKIGDYWRVFISGDCSVIPVRILRKKCGKRKQIKDVLVTGITVNPVGEEDYYGFSVDGNHLFLLADYTVTHNSGTGKSLALVAAAIANLKRKKKVLYITLEINQDAVADRFDAQMADPGRVHGITTSNLYEKKEIVFKVLDDYVEDYKKSSLDGKMMIVKQFAGATLDVPSLRAYFSQLKMHGFSPDLVIIDYIGEMKDYPGVKTHESRYMIVRDLRGFAVEENVCVLSAMQPNKSGKEAVRTGMLMDEENLGDSFSQIKPLDAFWTINQLQDEKECGLARVYVAKTRDGKSRFSFYIQFNYDNLSMREISQSMYDSIYKKHKSEKEETIMERNAKELEQKKLYDRPKKNANPTGNGKATDKKEPILGDKGKKFASDPGFSGDSEPEAIATEASLAEMGGFDLAEPPANV